MIKGLDTLRILALVAVTWQHAASVLGYYESTQWRGISPGQVGVGIFCAISGFLAFRSHRYEGVTKWLINRLVRIFPAYWLTTAIAFLLAFFVSDKPLSAGLFLSQMLGLGFFTHGWGLVNVVSWFISLLLLCYIIAAIALKSGRPSVILWLVLMVSVLACVTRVEVDLSRHIISFSLAGLVALQSEKYSVMPISLGFVLIGLFFYPQLFYSGTALILLQVVLRFPFEDHALVKIFANYSFEYFLVHGIFLVGVVKFVPYPLVAIVLAIFLAAICAFLLSKLTRIGIGRLQKVIESNVFVGRIH